VTLVWGIVYRVDSDAVIIADVFAKKTKRAALEAQVRCLSSEVVHWHHDVAGDVAA